MLAAEAAAHKAGKKSGGGHGHGHGGDGKETSWAPLPTEEITFAGPRGPLMAA